jgi:hypothetical protein
MSNGTLVVPAKYWVEQQSALKRVDQEQFALGFDITSLVPSGPEQVALNLDSKSRAAQQGDLLHSDVLTPNSTALQRLWDFERNMTLIVRRDAHGVQSERRLTWWPRSWMKVESYQWGSV